MEHRRSLPQTEVYVNGRKRKDLLTVDKYGIFNEVLVLSLIHIFFLCLKQAESLPQSKEADRCVWSMKFTNDFFDDFFLRWGQVCPLIKHFFLFRR